MKPNPLRIRDARRQATNNRRIPTPPPVATTCKQSERIGRVFTTRSRNSHRILDCLATLVPHRHINSDSFYKMHGLCTYTHVYIHLYYAPAPHKAEALSDNARLTSVCLSRTSINQSINQSTFVKRHKSRANRRRRQCIGPKSRTERPKKTKIGTEVGQVTRDSDLQGQKVKGQLAGAAAYCGGLAHSLLRTKTNFLCFRGFSYEIFFGKRSSCCSCDYKRRA